jgi:hypothetical protein
MTVDTTKPRHEPSAHVVEVDLWATKHVRGGPEDIKHWVRWRCSCGRLGPSLKLDHVTWAGRTSATRRARSGGAAHARAMER